MNAVTTLPKDDHRFDAEGMWRFPTPDIVPHTPRYPLGRWTNVIPSLTKPQLELAYAQGYRKAFDAGHPGLAEAFRKALIAETTK